MQKLNNSIFFPLVLFWRSLMDFSNVLKQVIVLFSRRSLEFCCPVRANFDVFLH